MASRVAVRGGKQCPSRQRRPRSIREGNAMRCGLLLVICGLTLSSTGCNWGMGYILRGDWSLELNRKPWDGGPACTPGVDPGCAPGVGQARRPIFGRGLNRGCGSLATQGETGYYNHPRFHPVPTGPIFLRGQSADRTYGPVAPADSLPPSPGAARSTSPGATAEQVPTPPGAPDGGQTGEATLRRLSPPRQASWFFTPRGQSSSSPKLAQRADLRWVGR